MDSLTEQQYQVLVQVEKDRLTHEEKAYEKAKKEAKTRRGRGSRGRTKRVNESPVKGESVSIITKK